MTCKISANDIIYHALLNKASSYPADKVYQAKAYREGADAVANEDKDLFEFFRQYPHGRILSFGPKVHQYIVDIVNIHNEEFDYLTDALGLNGNYNKLIAHALLAKADTYPEDSFQQDAYIRASVMIENAPFAVTADNCGDVDGVENYIRKFISNFLSKELKGSSKKNKPAPAPATVTQEPPKKQVKPVVITKDPEPNSYSITGERDDILDFVSNICKGLSITRDEVNAHIMKYAC